MLRLDGSKLASPAFSLSLFDLANDVCACKYDVTNEHEAGLDFFFFLFSSIFLSFLSFLSQFLSGKDITMLVCTFYKLTHTGTNVSTGIVLTLCARVWYWSILLPIRASTHVRIETTRRRERAFTLSDAARTQCSLYSSIVIVSFTAEAEVNTYRQTG